MALPIPAGTYAIDTMHTHLSFAVRHLGISTVRGSFPTFTGSLTVGEDLASTSVTLEAETASVSTGVAMRDGHVQGADFFDVANHPKLSFTSTSITGEGDQYTLNGDLTIRGITKPITLDVTFNGSGIVPMDQSTRYGFEATGKVNRTDWNMTFGSPMVSDTVSLVLDAQFVHPVAG